MTFGEVKKMDQLRQTIETPKQAPTMFKDGVPTYYRNPTLSEQTSALTTDVLNLWMASTFISGEYLMEMTGPRSSIRKLVLRDESRLFTTTPVAPPERTEKI